MQFFRVLRAHGLVRALGLVFAYVLVVQSLLLPLHALAASLPDHSGLLCQTVVNPAAEKIVSERDKGGQIRDAASAADEILPHHGCEIGCLMQQPAAGPAVADQHGVRFAFHARPFDESLDQGFAFDPFAASLLSLGKAPGAPPRI